MSDINLDFTVSNNSINFTVEPNDITITPTDIQLTLSSNSLPLAGGSNQQVQYNNQNLLDGSSTFTFNNTSNVVTITNGVIANANIQNGTINANAITAVYSNLGNIANLKIAGGTNGYVLQTDGTGNLDWTAMTGGGGGNGTPGGSNTQIQYNDAGSFGGNSGFTFNEITGNVAIPGNLSIVGNIFANNFSGIPNFANYAGNVTVSAQPNITSVGSLISLTVSGNITTTGTTSIQQAKEKITTNSVASTGTIDFNLLDQAILYKTSNATANYTLNFVGNSTTTLNSILNTNESITCAFINTNGTNGYYANTIQIDGNTITPKWVYPTGAPTVGVNNALETYNFNIIKTASATYTVLASRIGYQ